MKKVKYTRKQRERMIADWASTADALGLDYKDGIIDGELVGAVLRLQAERDELKNLRDAAHTRYCLQSDVLNLLTVPRVRRIAQVLQFIALRLQSKDSSDQLAIDYSIFVV